MNEPQPFLLCLNNLHGLRRSSKSPIGGWQRFYDCPRNNQVFDVLQGYLDKSERNKKRRFKEKKLNPKLAIKVKGCPQSKNFRATENILLDSELFIGGSFSRLKTNSRIV